MHTRERPKLEDIITNTKISDNVKKRKTTEENVVCREWEKDSIFDGISFITSNIKEKEERKIYKTFKLTKTDWSRVSKKSK